jgi:ribonuclease P protein subunit POP4
VRVADAANDDAIGITGRVASETERTLIIENADERERQVPKGNAVFEFALAPTAADDESEDEERRAERTYVTVEGTRLIANPARRTERKRRSKWR